MMTLKNLLPEHLSFFVPQGALAAPLARPKVSCSPCQERATRGSVKCCDYWPFMPNFLLGAGLEDSISGPLIESMLERPDVELLPLGVNVPRDYQAWYKGVRPRGNSDRHCPYYLQATGQCSVWFSRPAECAAFFCAYDSSHSQDFWGTLGQKLNQLEYSLSALVMLEFGYLWSEIREQLDALGESSENADKKMDLQGRVWAHYQSSPIYFYRRSWEIYQSRRELWREWLKGWFDSPQGLA